MKKTIFIIFGLILGFFIFMPKTNLIYFIQKELSKQNIYLNTDISSHLFSITLNKSTLYYNGINTANIDDIEIYPFILYNKITINNIKFNIGNYKIKKLKIIYNVFSPKKASVTANSNIGNIRGYIDIINKKIFLRFNKVQKASIKKLLKKDKKGYFYYVNY